MSFKEYRLKFGAMDYFRMVVIATHISEYPINKQNDEILKFLYS